MIRTYRQEDLDAITHIAQAGLTLTQDEIVNKLQTDSAFVYEDGEIKGFATFAGGELLLYVHPAHRGNGIGRALWDHIWPVIQSTSTVVIARCRVDQGSSAFFKARGFTKIVDVHLMSYAGPAYPEPVLDAQPYEDRFFQDYIQLNNDAFYELRKEAGIDPFVYAAAAYSDETLRQDVLDKKENIYCFFHSGRPIALAEIAGPYLETVAVAPDFQGKGYGRSITQFAVNRLKERGVTRVLLYVGEPNLRARRLYEHLGFERVQVVEISRTSTDPPVLL